mmetsp:Transcript_17801/g.26663  ORF Transcript_17801/g.26663 Transcript_17801/m.26663 type:complete len:102 (+) Transcript_17801:68-373(+)
MVLIEGTAFLLAAGGNTLLAVGGNTLLAVGGAQVALHLVGFGATGIAAGSMAAAWQSSVGNVAAGSAFALIQSFGMTGGFLNAGIIAPAAVGMGLQKFMSS